MKRLRWLLYCAGITALLVGVVMLWRHHPTPKSVRATPTVSLPKAMGGGPAAATTESTELTEPRPHSVNSVNSVSASQTEQSVFAEFAAWAERLASAQPAAQAALLAEGETLAKARYEQMVRLIQDDPEQALARALPYRLRKAMPADLAGYLEQPVSGRADFEVVVSGLTHESTRGNRHAPPPQYRVTFGRTRYQAFTYGVRTHQPSRRRVPVHGVTLTDAQGRSLMALSADALRPVDPDEATDLAAAGKVPSGTTCPVCGTSGAATRQTVLADLGGEYVTFDHPLHRQIYNEQVNEVLTTQWPDPSVVEDPAQAPDLAAGELYPPEPPQHAGSRKGIKRLLYMPAMFADDPIPPQSQDGAQATCANNARLFQENSYGTVNWFTDVTPPLRLPQRKAAYADAISGSTPLDVRGDALAIARSLGYVHQYDNVYVLFNHLRPVLTLGGQASGNGGLLNGSPGTLTHEMGHSYSGWIHASYLDLSGVNPTPGGNTPLDSDSFIGRPDINAPLPWGGNGPQNMPEPQRVEYGDQLDIMGSGGGHFNAIFKNQINWLPDQYVRYVNSSQTNRIYAFDVPRIFSDRLYALRFRKNYDKEYWLSHRQGYADNPWLSHGVEVQWKSGATPNTLLIDTTYATTPGKNDCAVTIGRTFADPPEFIYITPVAEGGDTGTNKWIDVVVNFGPFPTNQPPTVSIQASALHVDPGVMVTFTATAQDINGDTLAYNWDFGDLTFGPNAPVAANSWITNGQYVVRCEVSDMKGGVASAYVVVVVGNPSTRMMSGRVLDIYGNPLEGVRVHNGSAIPAYDPPDEGSDPTPPPVSPTTYRYAYTDSQGYYTIGNIPPGTYTNRAVLYGYRIDPLFTDPIVMSDADAAGLNHQATPLPRLRVDRLSDAPENGQPEPESGVTNAGWFRIGREPYAAGGSVYSDNSKALEVFFRTDGTARWAVDYLPWDGNWWTNFEVRVVNGRVITNVFTNVANFGHVIIPAGSDYVDMPVVGIDNGNGDGDKSVIMNLLFHTNDLRISSVLTNIVYTNWVTTNVFYLVTTTAVHYVTNNVAIPGWEQLPTGPSGQTMWFQTYPTYVLAKERDTLWLIDDDPPNLPTVGVRAIGSLASETYNDSGMFMFTRNNAPMTGDLVVYFEVGGSASNGLDCVLLPNQITIKAGHSFALLPVQALSDLFVEGSETVRVSILPNEGSYQGHGSATVMILDQNLPQVIIYASDSVASRAGNNNARVTVARTGDLVEPLVVNYLVSGTAVSGRDFQPLPQQVTVPAGSITADIVIVPIVNSIPGARTVVIRLADSPAYNLDYQDQATVTIQDSVPNVTLRAEGSVAEGATATVTVSRDSGTNTSLMVYFAVGGSAVEGSDYSPIGTNILFQPGSLSTNIVIDVRGLNDDGWREFGDKFGNETIIIQLLAGSDYNLGAQTSGTLQIQDNDANRWPQVGFMMPSTTVRQGAGVVNVLVKCSANPEANLPVCFLYSVMPGASAVSNLDYTVGPWMGTNTPLAAWEETGIVTNLVEVIGIGRFTHFTEAELKPSALNFYHPEDTIGYIPVTILDDGAPLGNKSLTLRLYSTNLYVTNFPIFTNVSGNITNVWTNTTLTVIGTNAYLGDYLTHRINIIDTDVYTVRVEAEVGAAYEAGLRKGRFAVFREGPTTAPLTVAYSITGTAAPGNDYVPLTTSNRLGTVIIPSGTNRATLEVVPIDDPEEELVETVEMNLIEQPGYRVGGGYAAVSLVSDDGTVQFSSARYDVLESAGLVWVPVVRSGDTNRLVTVDYTISDRTASNRVDYLGTNGTLVFAPGVIQQDIALTILDNSVVEPEKIADLTLQNPTGGVPLGGQFRASVYILNDDTALVFPTNTFVANENGGNGVVRVSRIGLTNEPVSVTVTTYDGTATNGVDYTSVSVQVAFAAGETNQTAEVPILDDMVFEGDETVRLILSDPSPNAYLGTPREASLVIFDDECAITFAATNFVVWEYAPYAAVTVVRTGGAVNPVGVEFVTYEGTASSGFDYLGTNGILYLRGHEWLPDTNGTGELIFQHGDTNLTLYIPLLDDVTGEGNEWFGVGLDNIETLAPALPGATVYGPIGAATVTILDNELPGNVDYEFTNPSVSEPGPNGPVHALVVQPDGQCVFGGDFTRVDGNVFNRVARMQTVGVADAFFNPGFGANGPVYALALAPDQRIVVGGAFTRLDTSNWVGVARLRANGDLDPSFILGAGVTNGIVRAVAVQADRKIVLGGTFQQVNGAPRTSLARLNENGSVDALFTVAVDGPVFALAIQPDQKIVVGGAFANIGGATRQGVARLLPNGTVDPAFTGAAGLNNAVSALAVQPDGRIVVGGSFTRAGGRDWNYLTRLNADGSVDTTFVPGTGPDAPVSAVALSPRGQILIGGSFTRYNGASRNRFARLRAEGALDVVFNIGTGANGLVRAVAAQADSAVLIGGDFTVVNGLRRTHLARLHGDEKMSVAGIEFAQAVFAVAENAGVATVTVVRTGDTNSTFSVGYATSDGTALNGINYQGASGTLTFAPGQVAQTFNITIIDDLVAVGDLTVNLALNNIPPNVDSSGTTAAVLLIQEYLTAVRFSSTDYGVSSDSSNAVITVVRQGALSGSPSVMFGTSDGTATAPGDYLTVTNLVVFAPGQTNQDVLVPLGNNPSGPGQRYFVVSLSDPAGAALAYPSDAMVTIANNAGTIAFSASSYTVLQGNDVVLTLVRTNGSSGQVAVDLTISPGTAVPGLNYLATNVTVVFGEGQTEAVVYVTTYYDPTADGALYFFPTLSNPAGGVLIGGSRTTTVNLAYPATGPGHVDRSFEPGTGANGLVRAVALQPDAGLLKYVVAGAFTNFDGVPHMFIARLNPEGSVDDTFLGPAPILVTNYVPVPNPTNPAIILSNMVVVSTNGRVALGANAMVSSVAVMPNAKVVIGGVFTEFTSGLMNTTSRQHVAMLTTNGMVDSYFNPPLTLSAAAYALLPMGARVYMGGGFVTPVAGIGRLRADGGLDVSFNPGAGANGNVFCVATQANGQVLLGGSFTAVDGVARARLARLNPSGAVDADFAPQIMGGSVFALAVQPDGRILVAGDFTGVNGTAHSFLVRLLPSGMVDPTFVGEADGAVYAVGMDPLGRIVIGGDFTSVLGGVRIRVARLLADGLVDAAFDPGLGANGTVYSLALLPDGRVLIAGEFTEVDGLARGRVALLNGDASPPRFEPVAPPVNGILTLVVTAQPGQTCVLDSTSDFTIWTPVATNAALGGTVTFEVPIGSAPGANFFRVRYGQ